MVLKPIVIVILIHNITVITLAIQLVTILAKVIVAQTLIQEDVADIENNISDTTKAYSTEYVL
jgi:hypothetical protein